MWPFKRRKIAEQIAPPKRSAFTTDLYPALAKENGFNGLVLPQPMINGVGMDSIDTSVPSFKGEQVYGVPESQAAWYASQMFIGNNMCAIIAKHWLVDKACKYQAKGSYQPSGDYATNTALNNGLNAKLNTNSVTQSTGASTTNVMSQKAVTDALQNAVNLNTIYPVGIVVWFAQNKNPNTLFPDTKWQYIGENKTIRLAAASGANVLTNGGSDLVTIGKNHLPATPLKLSGATVSGGAHDHTWGTMNITGELGYMKNDSDLYTYATGAFSLANGSGNGGYTGSNLTNSRKYVFNAVSTCSCSTSQYGGIRTPIQGIQKT